MAALVSHAMRRYPLSPPDGVYSSYSLKGDNNTWSQTPEQGESALSRSMRYADPWLYGSVRGAPPGSLVLAPAFVLCSCPDYLNGTKKSSHKKGPTVCKKCKGTRIAVSGNGETKFGTVRCYPTSSSSTALHSSTNSQVRAGTVRVTSSSRPSILPSTADPYDLMRKSRLNASSEANSPFRCRSISPSKRNGSSRTGRRSILECDINPYELMSTDVEPPPKDSSITFVNGQRIRVRPQAPDPDYEDLDDSNSKKPPENAVETTRPKPNRTAPEPPSVSPLAMNEADRNNPFKSILKKSSNFDITTMSSTSPTRRSGSHFYLPLPNSPRKKVQFLVESYERSREIVKEGTVETCPDYEDIESGETNDQSEVFEAEENSVSAENDNKVCTLRRSTSERFKVEPPKVVFLDTMALRSKVPRGDARDTFNHCDLEKLDGLVPKRKISPRPKDPPPLPPLQPQSQDFQASEVKRQDKIENEIEKEEKQNRNKHRTKEPPGGEFPLELQKEYPTSKLMKNLAQKTCESSSDSEYGKSKKSACSYSEQKKESKESSAEINEITRKITPPVDLKQINKPLDSSEGNNKPQVPPRKRSNNKQPLINIQYTNDEYPKEQRYESKDDEKNISLENNVSREISEKPPLRKRSNNKQPSFQIQTISEKTYGSVQAIVSSNTELSAEKMEPPISSSIRIEETGMEQKLIILKEADKSETKMDYSKRTVVQITPSSSPVHKIQIRNEFPETNNVQTISILDNAQRKTSIMINGDDCYSTVNVSDDVPLYQSSVVVRDYGIKDFVPTYRRSSSVYITGSFNDNSSPNNNLNKTTEEIKNDINRSEPCICKHNAQTQVTKEEKVDKEVSTDSSDLDQSLNVERSSTPDMLREILKDPVEAVKRNLVPHICGKSDVSRRPRDSKLKNQYPLLSFKETTAGTPGIPRDDSSPLRTCNFDSFLDDEKDACSEHSSSTQYEFVDAGSDCYTDHSNRSSVTEEELNNRTKFYELLADSSLLEVSENEDHHYECIGKNDADPIYEEIEIPPPLPSNPPPTNLLDDLKLDKEFTTRSIFEGASKYDILSYLVDAKERGIVPEDSYTFSSISTDDSKESSPKVCHISNVSDSSEDNSLVITGALIDDKNTFPKSSEIERNDSGVGSETSKSSLSKYRSKPVASVACEDCEGPLEAVGEDEPMLCRKCLKKRSERKEIIMEIVETEEKYSKDLQIILEEFYQPMLVAGLLTAEQLSTIFLNVEELLENSQSLAERLRDAVEIAIEQGDEDLLTVNIGKLFLEAAPMLHAFETYCVRQGPASLLLASLEKEKELLRIFLRVSQMENTLLRRMNLNSFLMVPVQRVTKYPFCSPDSTKSHRTTTKPENSSKNRSIR
ncbi:hypothetical protein HHI36_020350 [Cryptolaemus montrouzieri]|uniref:DH domain-containing protein n=1 Tax=Cryptolaemus montrouzieri TaxID=559131 RepID=A0ABD2NA06_9CUCU